jgi:hypothetical protein
MRIERMEKRKHVIIEGSKSRIEKRELTEKSG